jgi:hypothetical protein
MSMRQTTTSSVSCLAWVDLPTPTKQVVGSYSYYVLIV